MCSSKCGIGKKDIGLVPYRFIRQIKNTKIFVAFVPILNSDSWLLNSGTALWDVGKARLSFQRGATFGRGLHVLPVVNKTDNPAVGTYNCAVSI